MTATWTLHPDRLLPAEPSTRAVARRLYAAVKDLPIISPHGHVPPEWIAQDIPFHDPTSLLITPDHYVCRLMHASGVELADLGVNQGPLDEAASRRAWRIFCQSWPLYRGTPSRFWMETELVEIFGVTQRPSATTADAIYDQIAGCLARPEFRPRALMDSFDIALIATTDDPCDDLRHHQALRDEGYHRRVLPTFRPDRYLEPGRAEFPQLMGDLAAASGIDTGDYRGFIAALENRRAYFKAHGAVSTDHSHADVITLTLEEPEAARIYAAALAGTASEDEATALRRHLLVEMARMSVEDGLVMTLHPAVFRNHDPGALAAYGPDTGHDIPLAVEFTRGLQPLLARYGNADGFHLVLFTLDETVFSREIAPLAGYYRSVYAGVPWWFIDAPEAMRRFRGAVTETAGFTRTSGFIDDTRAFCSIPARHDMSRRVDCGVLAQLVVEHRLDEDEALDTAVALVAHNPRQVFKL